MILYGEHLNDGIKRQFDKKTTNIIKGMMLIFMFILHFFTEPEQYVSGISYPQLASFSVRFKKPFDICVPVFAFLTGYFYHYCLKKDYKYSLKKVKQIMIPYWMVFFVLLLIGIITNTYVFKISTFILEMFALYRPVMWFCWYVAFYVVSMMLLPLSTKFSNNILTAVVCGMILPYGIGVCLNHFWEIPIIVSRLISDVSTFYPVISMGYICAKFHIFEMIDYYICHQKRNMIVWGGVTVTSIILFIGQFYITQDALNNLCHGMVSLFLYYLSIPLFVFCLIIIINCWKIKSGLWILGEIGKKSMYMWFVHSIFFNCSKEVFQRKLYWPNNPVLVDLWGLLICWCAALGIDTLYRKLSIRYCVNEKRKFSR